MKLTRYNGHVPLFSQNMEGRERTLFGSTVQDDDINNQFTPEFLRGWGSVGSTEFPTLQDFNALAYTHNKLLSYLYQAGIPSYTENEEYYIGSIVQYNKDIYICLRDKPTVLPTDTNAWKRVQESLTFVGDGPEVMKKGAFGIGGRAVVVKGNDVNFGENVGYKSGIYVNNSFNSGFERSAYGIYVRHGTDVHESFLSWGHTNVSNISVEILTPTGRYKASILNNLNTRTDKNNVLHAGTSTPINTLNVSDMSQEVINNDLLTVTSGAVYRALQPKADSTYVNAELNKKANLTYVDSELLEKADLSYVNTELDKKITGGNVVQTLGQSTVDVMSQKAYTDLTVGIGQSWVDVTSQRVEGGLYTNNTNKPIQLSIAVGKSGVSSPSYELLINNIRIVYNSESADHASSAVLNLIVMPGSTYKFRNISNTTVRIWSELR